MQSRGARRFISYVVGAAISAMFVACDDDATGPGLPLSGSYVLVEFNGNPLPFTPPLMFRRPETWLAETLVFSPSGDVVRVRTIERTYENRDSTFTLVTEAEYRVQGSHIAIGYFSCPDYLDCELNDQGTLTADGIELQAFSVRVSQSALGGGGLAQPATLFYEAR